MTNPRDLRQYIYESLEQSNPIHEKQDPGATAVNMDVL